MVIVHLPLSPPLLTKHFPLFQCPAHSLRFKSGANTTLVNRDYADEMPGIMKTIVAIVSLIVAVTAESCYKDVDVACTRGGIQELVACNASYGLNLDYLMIGLNNYANAHITRSFQHLLMSVHFGNYQKSREGFQKLFRELSDAKWEAAIDLIKHVTRRGGSVALSTPAKLAQDTEDQVYELYELQSLAKALDLEKQDALEAFAIHDFASEKGGSKHDPEVSSYLEEEFVEKQSETIRTLAGHVSDLSAILRGPDASLGLWLFDEQLKK